MPELNPDGVSVKGCSIIYAPAGQAGEYSALATNPFRGCGHSCAYCLSPETLIQKADGTSVPLSDIQIGEDLIGIKTRAEIRRAWNHTFANSVVLNKLETVKLAIRVTVEDGRSVICSPDHRWLTERGWKFTSNLTLNNVIRTLSEVTATPAETTAYRRGYLSGMIRGDAALNRYDYSGKYTRAGRSDPQKTDILYQFRLALKDLPALMRSARYLDGFGVPTTQFDFFSEGAPMEAIRANSRTLYERIQALIQTSEDNPEWLRGWLAGIFDAEGGAAEVLRIHNTDENILSLTDSAMRHFGFGVSRDVAKENGCSAVRLLGGLKEIVKFFNLTAPAITRKFPVIDSALKGTVRVIGIEPLNHQIKMLDITTSTENFIANGMVSHNCYVPNVLRMDRKEFDAGAVPRKNFLKELEKDARKYQALGVTEQCMLSFTTDPYPPEYHYLTREVLESLKAHGLGICTLTKGGKRALRDLDLFRPGRDAFASTLTSIDPAFSLKWERGATLPQERIDTLHTFHDAGIFTWVSLEPVLDTAATLEIIRQTHSFVDLYKCGRVNYVGLTKTTDWKQFTFDVLDVLQQTGARHYIKKDLQPYLPADYSNPMRVEQFRRDPFPILS